VRVPWCVNLESSGQLGPLSLSKVYSEKLSLKLSASAGVCDANGRRSGHGPSSIFPVKFADILKCPGNTEITH